MLSSDNETNPQADQPAVVENKPKADVKQQQETTSIDQESLIYCGPSLPRGALNRYTVYKGGLPQHLDTIFEECPAIQRLCVPVGSFSQVEQSILKTGSAENVWFNQALNYVRGGGKA